MPQIRSNKANVRIWASTDAALNMLIGFASAIGYALVFFREQIIPTNFSYDGLKIQAIANQNISGYGDSSYESVAWLYAKLGLGQEPLLASLLGYTLFLFSVVLVRRKFARVEHLGTSAALYVASIILGSVYLGFYSKDVFVTPIVLLAITFRFRLRSEILIAIAMAAYAINFRSYWFLVLALFLVFRRVNFLRFTRLQSFWFLSLVSLALSASVFIFMGASPDHFRELVNASRIGSSDATTAIPSFVNFEQPLAGAANNLLTFWFLFAPLPLLQLGQVAYVAIFVAISTVWILTANAVSRLKTSGQVTRLASFAWYFLLAFVSVQAVFEPDFGSALRHLTPLTPLMLIIVSTAAQNPRKASDKIAANVAA